ncbi:hypothetical protein GCM10009616_08100 [Microlunatus lacustris]
MASYGYCEVTFIWERGVDHFRFISALGLPDELIDSFPWEYHSQLGNQTFKTPEPFGHPVWFANHVGRAGWMFAGMTEDSGATTTVRRYSFTKRR